MSQRLNGTCVRGVHMHRSSQLYRKLCHPCLAWHLQMKHIATRMGCSLLFCGKGVKPHTHQDVLTPPDLMHPRNPT